MKFRLNISDSGLRDILRLKGVPMGLLESKFMIDTAVDFADVVVDTESEEVTIRAKDQANQYMDLVKNSPKTARIYVFTSRHNYIKARAAGLLAFATFVENEIGINQWIMANSSFKPIEVKKGLIAIDSISDDMSAYKRDKMHDICQEHCGRPLFIMHHGFSPYETCIDALGVKPGVIFNIDKIARKSGKKVREL